MFEEELKLQKESSFVIPLVLVLVLVAVIVGAIGYWMMPGHSLSQQQAAGLVSAYLNGEGPATVHFHVGVLQASVDEKIRDPHYRLLEKAGILKLSPAKGDAITVAFAPVPIMVMDLRTSRSPVTASSSSRPGMERA